MPTISIDTSIAAGVRSSNVLAGEQFEFLADNSIVTVSAAGTAVGVFADMTIGGVSVMANVKLPATNRFPVRPDDTVMTIGGVANSRLFLTYFNSTGAAITVSTLIDLDPV